MFSQKDRKIQKSLKNILSIIVPDTCIWIYIFLFSGGTSEINDLVEIGNENNENKWTSEQMEDILSRLDVHG